MRASVAAVDLAKVSASEASNLFEVGAELEKLGASLKVLVAPKIAQSDVWARAGSRSPEEQLSATALAVNTGALSLAQASAVAEGATASPKDEAQLLETAGRDSLKVLQDKARRVVLDSRGSVEERYARQRKLREFSSWLDDEGMTAGRFRLTPEIGASVINKITAEADRHFRRGYKDGRREDPKNYAADAFAAVVTGEGLIGTKSKSKGTEVVVVVSRDSLLRGTVDPESDEPFEVPGFGAIPVSRAREMLSDCFLKGVLVDCTKVVTVKHFGRHRPAELDPALLVRCVLEDGQVICKVEVCGDTARIQWDHCQPFALGGATSEDNLDPKCSYDNQLKERGLIIRTPDGSLGPDRRSR